MFRNTQASVGQNPGRVLSALRERIGGNCNLQIADRHSLSPVPRPLTPRRGINLTEVLIAMGILTVGLLGVASIFPVASFYMQKGDVADKASAIAQAAFNDVLSRGMLNPEAWLMWEDGVIKPGAPADISPGVTNTFTRRVSDKLRQQSAQLSAIAAMSPTARQWNVGTEFGAAYVIDPMAVASVSQGANNYGTKFPATVFRLDQNVPYYSPSWQPWYFSMALPETPLSGWPIRRVTLPQGPLTPLSMAVAERLFTSSDDLAIDVPTASDKPSKLNLQLANLDGGGSADDPVARQSRGDYSWIVTVSPGSSDALNGLATDPSAFSYEVSVAVFYKRVLGRIAPQSIGDVATNLDLLMQNERLVQAKVMSTGLSGGELLLEKVEPSPSPPESPFAGLKAGNWYLLAGPHPNSTGTRPMFVARWYRVLSIEGKNSKLDANGNPTTNPAEPERRLVTLRGPQWPWEPQNASTDLSNNLCLGVIPGVVAVHAKTIRFEGKSAWSVQ